MPNFKELILSPKCLLGVSIFISGFAFGSNWGKDGIVAVEPKQRCYLSKVDGSFNCLDWKGGNVLGKRNWYLPSFFKKSSSEDVYWIDWETSNPEFHILKDGSKEYGNSLFQRLDVLMEKNRS